MRALSVPTGAASEPNHHVARAWQCPPNFTVPGAFPGITNGTFISSDDLKTNAGAC